jgi:hypothetical protein
MSRWAFLEQIVFSWWLSGLPATKWHPYWLDGLLAYCTKQRKKAENEAEKEELWATQF